MSTKNFGCMYIYGTGSAINIPLGGVPDFALAINLTDGDRIDVFNYGRNIPFTSGGVTPILAGDKIKGATSGAVARVADVIIATGSWAGGDAAGMIILDDGDPEKTGTFTTENIYKTNDQVTGIDDATITVDVPMPVVEILGAVATNAANGITAYVGDTSNARGITLGTDPSEDNKLLFVCWWFGDRTLYRVAV